MSKMSPERSIRQIVARKLPYKNTDPNLEGAVRFILQQQHKKARDKADMSITTGDDHSLDQLMRRIHNSMVAEEILVEAKDDAVADATTKLTGAKDSIANQIGQALNRFSMTDKGEDRGILLLMAALMLLNVSDDDSNNATARRLIAAGLLQMRKKA